MVLLLLHRQLEIVGLELGTRYLSSSTQQVPLILSPNCLLYFIDTCTMGTYASVG